jgi:putative SOS response-associated peptidase YedK
VNPHTEVTTKSFSVINAKANSLLDKIHNTRKRMLAILQRENERLWLDENLDEERIKSILSP